MAMVVSLRSKGLFGAGRAIGTSRAKERTMPPAPVCNVADEADCIRCSDMRPSCPSMPLAFAGAGVEAAVLSVRGSKESCHHLESLGFVEGARIKVVCEAAGNLIVEVKGSQVALDRRAAMKVSVGV